MEKNETYGDPKFVTKCAEVCCVLHNFLTERGRVYEGELLDLPVHALPVAGAAAPAANVAGAAAWQQLEAVDCGRHLVSGSCRECSSSTFGVCMHPGTCALHVPTSMQQRNPSSDPQPQTLQ